MSDKRKVTIQYAIEGDVSIRTMFGAPVQTTQSIRMKALDATMLTGKHYDGDIVVFPSLPHDYGTHESIEFHFELVDEL